MNWAESAKSRMQILGIKPYHKIPIEGLDDIEPRTRQPEVDFDIVSREIDFTNKTVLEIGCANGLYSFGLSDKAESIIAYESNPSYHSVNEWIRDKFIESFYNITFVNAKLNLWNVSNESPVDIVLMLDVHMDISSQVGRLETFALMKELALKCKTLIFQTEPPEGRDSEYYEYLKGDSDVESYLELCGFSNISAIQRTCVDGVTRVMYEADGFHNTDQTD